MQTQWFGDPRDVVKWSLLVRLAKDKVSEATRIIQIVCRWVEEKDKSKLWNDEERAVAQFFQERRKLESIKQLKDWMSLTQEIEVPDIQSGDSTNPREGYFENVSQYLSKCPDRKIVLLDPDTGLQPDSGGTAKHITLDNMRTTYDSLKRGDTLVLYQHQPLIDKNVEGWRKANHNKIAKKLKREIKKNEIKIEYKPEIADDVVFFYMKKKK